MSTHIATIKGTYHKFTNKEKIVQEEAELEINRFYNGKELGTSVQLSIFSNYDGYICLTKEQCLELAEILQNCFDYDKSPSE